MNLRLIEAIAIGLILLSGLIAVQAYYNERHRECLDEPLVYAAKKYESQTGHEFVGSGYFRSDEKPLNSPTIHFTSQGIDVSEPESEQVNPWFANFSV